MKKETRKNRNRRYEKMDYSRPNENRKAKVTAARVESMDNWEEDLEEGWEEEIKPEED